MNEKHRPTLHFTRKPGRGGRTSVKVCIALSSGALFVMEENHEKYSKMLGAIDRQ